MNTRVRRQRKTNDFQPRISRRCATPSIDSLSARTPSTQPTNQVRNSREQKATLKNRPMQTLVYENSQTSRLLDRLTPLILLGLACSVFYFSLTGNNGLLYLDKLNNQLDQISTKNKALEAEISQLRYDIDSVNSKGFHLEKKAREELGLSKKGETIYLFNN